MKPSERGRKSATTLRTLTADDFKAMIDDWEAKHPNGKLDEKQKQFMLRVYLRMQKDTPGWVL